MDAVTWTKINQINSRFYEERALDFSKSRNSSWYGWEIVWNLVLPFLPIEPNILDVGCGNGRFGLFLKEKNTSNFSYTGIDQSTALLRLAEKNLSVKTNCQLIHADVMKYRVINLDFIGVFGLLHHIPDTKQRTILIKKLIAGLKPGGVIALSFWRVDDLLKLTHKSASQKEIRTMGINPSKMEPGDYFLPFANKVDSWRYVHSISPREIEGYKKFRNTESLSEFKADGRNGQLNTYLVLKKLPQEQRKGV